MSTVEVRGGFPVVLGGTVTTAGAVTPDRGGTIPAGTAIRLGANQVQDELEGRRGPIICKSIEIRNLDGTAGNALRVYFSQDAFDDDVNYITIPGGSSQLSTWFGPAELVQLWMKSAAGTPRFEIVAYNRRG